MKPKKFDQQKRPLSYFMRECVDQSSPFLRVLSNHLVSNHIVNKYRRIKKNMETGIENDLNLLYGTITQELRKDDQT